MIDITTLPNSELLADLLESVSDIVTCKQALALGITTYGDGESVAARITVNEKIMDVIAAELERRGIVFDAIIG